MFHLLRQALHEDLKLFQVLYSNQLLQSVLNLGVGREGNTRICASLGLRMKFQTLFMSDEEKTRPSF